MNNRRLALYPAALASGAPTSAAARRPADLILSASVRSTSAGWRAVCRKAFQ